MAGLEMIALAVLTGYLIGSIPTASWIAAARGIDLRRGGTKNPGANNALKLGGMGLAAAVLFAEMGKGFAAAQIGEAISGDVGAVAAALAAITGNIYNVWYRFSGGKGLGITSGVLLAVWPPAFPILIGLIGLSAALTKNSGQATFIAMAGAITAALLWWLLDWGNTWGVSPELLPILTLGLALLILPKHAHDAMIGTRV